MKKRSEIAALNAKLHDYRRRMEKTETENAELALSLSKLQRQTQQIVQRKQREVDILAVQIKEMSVCKKNESGYQLKEIAKTLQSNTERFEREKTALKDALRKAVDEFRADFKQTMTSFVRSAFAEQADPDLVNWVTSKACSANKEAVLAIVLDTPNLDVKQSFLAAKVPIRCINSSPFPPMNTKTEVETNRKYADFDVVLMDGVGHFPMLERPEAFNDHLRKTLSEMANP